MLSVKGVALILTLGLVSPLSTACDLGKRFAECSIQIEAISPQELFDIGIAYSTGSGVEQSDTEAIKWIRSAAERGHSYAQFNLGEAFSNGTGIVQDFQRSVQWLTMAAKSGVTDAQVSLGLKYDSGLGVVQDKKEAVRWFRLAAQQGNPHGQNNLAIAYALGEGLPKNSINAYIWFELARINGSEVSEAYREQISQTMAPSEIAMAIEQIERMQSSIQSKWR